MKFFVLETAEKAYEKYKCKALLDEKLIKYPITTIEVHYKIGGTGIELKPTGTSIQTNSIVGNFTSHCGGGISLTIGLPCQENPSLLPYKPASRVKSCPCGSGLRFKHCHGLLNIGNNTRRTDHINSLGIHQNL